MIIQELEVYIEVIVVKRFVRCEMKALVGEPHWSII